MCHNMKITLCLLIFKSHLCNFFKILMPLLQSSGSVQRFANTCVFAEEGLAVVFYPVQNLYTCVQAHTHTNKQTSINVQYRAVVQYSFWTLEGAFY